MYMGEYCRVLIIDDEFITRQGIKHMMLWEKEGFQVVGEASNGQEGLELIEQVQPDIVLADIVMPILNGIEFSLILREKYPHIQLIILSSYDDFEYVKAALLNGAVDYILKPTLGTELLLETLNKAVRNIPGFKLTKSEDISLKKQLERYLSGYQEGLDETLFHESLPYMQFRILGIDIKSACGNSRKQIGRIRDWIHESYRNQEVYKHVSALVEEEVLCYVFNYRRKEEAELLKDIQDSVRKIAQLEENVLFVISGPFGELQQVKERYDQGIRPCVKQKFYFPDKNLIFEHECVTAKEVDRFDYETYTGYLKAERYEDVISMLREYIIYICEKRYDEYLIKNLTKNLLYNLLMEIEKYGIQGEKLKEQYFRRIDNTLSVDCFLAQCSSIYQETAELIERSTGNEDTRILEIKRYINEHYKEELDLEEISRVFNFNYHYISSYFNQHIPEGFSGYLNKIRITKACALLKESTMAIADVSGEAGYSDHSYFCRVFKKMTGQTPSQYRRSSQKAAEL